ncbi:MAG TPA: Xaa-Pro dipeptidyl-peptidase [Bacteroidetes bacterium]|nr:Xaa-Pro dipeptidyl-peptidase [Bacteroidota bacterium]
MKSAFSQYIYPSLFLVCLTPVSAQQADTGTHNGPVAVFINGEAQVVPEFSDKDLWIKEELWVETNFDSDNDGKPDRMHVYVTRPGQTDSGSLKLPVIYMSSPYNGLKLWALMGLSTKKNFWNVKHELGEKPKPHRHTKLGTRDGRPFLSMIYDRQWVPRGYIMVYSSSPGTGLSDGAPTIGGENESLAPKAVIDWLCGRAKGFKTRDGKEEVSAYWCNGKVGMTGTSYDGTLCIAAATTGVEGLEAIIPVAPVTSWYHYYRSNGLVRSPDGYLGEDMDVLYDLINTGDKSKRKKNNRNIRDSILLKHQDRITGDYNAFWASRDYLLQIDSMKAAMLMAHGFNDWNVMSEQSYRFYKAAKEKGLPVQLYYHQDDHGGDPPFSMMNRWFTRYLHGIENGVENDAPVRITREYSYFPTPYGAYPDSGASDVTFFLRAGENNSGTLSLIQPELQPGDTLIDDCGIKGQNLLDTINSKHRLLFVTPVLEQDIRISGIPRVTIRLSSSAPAANLSVWLVSLPWEEEKETKVYDNIINRAWADPQNYRSLTQGEPLKPGEFHEVSFDLMPDDQVIRKGQKIGLMIFSSDPEFTLWPDPGTELIIDLNATRIILPVVGGVEEFENAVPQK